MIGDQTESEVCFVLAFVHELAHCSVGSLYPTVTLMVVRTAGDVLYLHQLAEVGKGSRRETRSVVG
jgi:hypothetical protein